MVNGHSGKTAWYAKGFPPTSLSVHFSKHGKALGCKSKSEYNNKAVDFMNAEETKVLILLQKMELCINLIIIHTNLEWRNLMEQ